MVSPRANTYIVIVCGVVMFAPMLAFVFYRSQWYALVHTVFEPTIAECVRGGVPPLVGGIPALILSHWLRKKVALKDVTTDCASAGKPAG